jgi:hypothetical protein
MKTELPPLPEAFWLGRTGPRPYCDAYSETQMRDYAAAAVAAEREKCAVIAETSHPHDWAFIGAAIRNGGA